MTRFSLLLVALFGLISIAGLGVEARLSYEQKLARQRAADAADKEIDFISMEDLAPSIQKGGVWLVFFGAHWCPYTQRFTPKWLEVQKLVKANGLLNGREFYMRKLECSVNEDFCSTANHIDGYPTVILYKNGVRVEEYPDPDEVNYVYNYIYRQVLALDQENAAKAAAEQKQEQQEPVVPVNPAPVEPPQPAQPAQPAAAEEPKKLPSQEKPPVQEIPDPVKNAPAAAAVAAEKAAEVVSETVSVPIAKILLNMRKLERSKRSSGLSTPVIILLVCVAGAVAIIGYRAIRRQRTAEYRKVHNSPLLGNDS
ncbi:hypothetical protein HK102_003179 [Quaeritorhiza haematococci]|nr:hypothetical protein HK102_003179 [Quaeritorhiza haematococci]